MFLYFIKTSVPYLVRFNLSTHLLSFFKFDLQVQLTHIQICNNKILHLTFATSTVVSEELYKAHAAFLYLEYILARIRIFIITRQRLLQKLQYL